MYFCRKHRWSNKGISPDWKNDFTLLVVLLPGVICPKSLWSSQGVHTMSFIGIGIMWAFAFVAFAIVTKWPMGKECDKRTAFWAKYEGK